MRAALLLAGVACGGPGPLREALRPDPSAAFQVWVWTTQGDPEAGDWQRRPEPLLHSFSSLGLHAEGEGTARRLVLVGMPMNDQPSWWEEVSPSLRVWGLVSEPGLGAARAALPQAWEPRIFSLADPAVRAAIDPQGFEGSFWYHAAEGRGGDPAEAPGDHVIRGGDPAREIWRALGLADPSPVRFAGKVHAFATAEARAVMHARGNPLRIVGRFPGVTVPFAWTSADGASLYLVAQAVVEGRRLPVLAVSRDGRTWSDWRPILDPGALANCTSPVVGPLIDGWVLFCVEER